jgi:hypothetical protein
MPDFVNINAYSVVIFFASFAKERASIACTFCIYIALNPIVAINSFSASDYLLVASAASWESLLASASVKFPYFAAYTRAASMAVNSEVAC